MKLFLVRPAGKHSVNNTEFAWSVVNAPDVDRAVLVAVKWRKERGGLEPRPVYEVVPAKDTEQRLGKISTPSAHLTLEALWDWEKRVEVRV